MNDILSINAHLKYVEFLLFKFDKASPETTMGEIRKEFKEKFLTTDPLLNHNFGIYRLLPLILIKENYKNSKKELEGDVKKNKIIRDAIAHHQFTMNSEGYEFKNDKETLFFTYEEFKEFIYSIENDFYTNK